MSSRKPLTDDDRFKLSLHRPVQMCGPCSVAKAHFPDVPVHRVDVVRPAATVVPMGFKITKCSARWASGSRRPVKGGRGDGPATNSVATLVSSAYDKRAVTAYAATSNINKR